MKFPFPQFNSNRVVRLFRIALILTGLIIVFFNDTFGKIEGFIEFLFLYFITVCIALAQWLFVNIRFIIRLKNEKAKTELMHLQSQVNPHFFFNMLNNLYGLVDKDSKQAKQLILKLSDMMRYSIYEGQKEYVTLAQEIEFIRNFVALHQMRYHKKVDIQLEVELEDEQLKIMPLLFIILVENAFKHGVEVLRDNAFVRITICSTKKKLRLSVQNNFDKEEQGEGGIGLANLSRRLALAYPKKHQLSYTVEQDTYTATLSLSL